MLVSRNAQEYGNCAQTSFRAMQEHLQLRCNASDFVWALTPFPGIGTTGKTCGAVTGSLIALGLALGPDDPADKKQSETCHTAAHQFCLAFKKTFGSTDCEDIIERSCGKRYDLSSPEEAKNYAIAGGLMKCLQVVQNTVQMATEIIENSTINDENSMRAIESHRFPLQKSFLKKF